MPWEATRTPPSRAARPSRRRTGSIRTCPGPPVHVHPIARESYAVIEGALDALLDGAWKTIRAGESATAPAGVAHTLRNSTSEPVRLVNVHGPALEFEAMFARCARWCGSR
jgi:mannose-6-phosphate isomerase-like protein (cupin superfamily)